MSPLVVDGDVAVVGSVEHSVSVFYDNIVKSRGVGLRSSCFSSDRTVLCRLCSYHGIPVASSLCIEEMQHNLLRHLLTGDCFRLAESNSSLPRESRQCSHLSQPFPSATDLSLSFVRRILDDIMADQKLNIQKFSRLMLALTNASYTSDPFSQPTNVKRDAIRLLNRVLSVSSLNNDDPVLPTDLEKMSKTELLNFARRHSISFDRQTSATTLRNLILQHCLSARCIQNVNTNDWDRSPPSCAISFKTFLSTGQSADSACFVVYCLLLCARKMSLKPLRHIFSHLHIPFDTSDSLNQLRKRLSLYVSKMQKAPIGTDTSWSTLFSDLVATRESWPQLISPTSKERIRRQFLSLTNSSALKTGVCASCSESCPVTALEKVRPSSINLDLLRRPET